MKRALLCLAVVAMLVGSANAWVDVARWNFNELAPGNPASQAPGAILDSSGNGHNGTAVGSTVAPFVDPSFDPDLNFSGLVPPVYSDPLCDPQSALTLHKGLFNEGGGWGYGAGWIQDRVEVPNSPDFDLMLADGMSYRMEMQVQLPSMPYANEPLEEPNPGITGKDTAVLMTYVSRVMSGLDIVAQVPANGWIWRVEQNGYLPDNRPTAQFAFRVNGSWNSTDGRTDIKDGLVHTLAVELMSDGANVTVQLYCDGLADGPSQTFAAQNVIVPSTGVKEGLWMGDMLGRWDDQLHGAIDAVSISKVPEPSSIVLLVMGALALVGIRRVW